MNTELQLDEYSNKECPLPPPYEIYEDNGFTPNTNPYKAQQEAAVRLSDFRQKKVPQVKTLDWILSSISFVCCLACGIPSIIFTFSACKDAEEGKTIETNRKVKYGRGFALVAIVTGTVLYTACFSLIAVIVIVFILRNLVYNDHLMATEKEREAFGYEGEYHTSPGPSAPALQYPDLESAMYPGVVLTMDQPTMLPPNLYDVGMGAAAGPWVWILSISACIACPCLGIFSIIAAFLVRSSENKKDSENTHYWAKILKIISYTAIVSSLITILLAIGALIVAMSIILDDIVKITDSVNPNNRIVIVQTIEKI